MSPRLPTRFSCPSLALESLLSSGWDTPGWGLFFLPVAGPFNNFGEVFWVGAWVGVFTRMGFFFHPNKGYEGSFMRVQSQNSLGGGPGPRGKKRDETHGSTR